MEFKVAKFAFLQSGYSMVLVKKLNFFILCFLDHTGAKKSFMMFQKESKPLRQ